MEAALTHHTVPPHRVQGWRQERLAWCAWVQGARAQPKVRTLARYRRDLQRHRDAGESLPAVAELQRVWNTAPTNGGQASAPAWARVEQLASGWWLTLSETIL